MFDGFCSASSFWRGMMTLAAAAMAAVAVAVAVVARLAAKAGGGDDNDESLADSGEAGSYVKASMRAVQASVVFRVVEAAAEPQKVVVSAHHFLLMLFVIC
jgi:hypothetical protein